MNPIDAWNGVYLIRDLKIDHSETHLKVDEHGVSNFNVTKKNAAKGSISFDLQNIQLRQTKVTYHDLKALQHFDFDSRNLAANVALHRNVYEIKSTGDVTVLDISVAGYRVMQDKKLELDASLLYDDNNKSIKVNPSTVKFEKSLFDLNGAYFFKKIPQVDIAAKSKNATIQTILSLLPQQFSEALKQYQSKGNIYFNLTLKGEISKNKRPLLAVDFGWHEAELIHPKFKSRLEEANMEGSFAASSFVDLSNARLFLKNVKGKLNGEPFTANFR